MAELAPRRIIAIAAVAGALVGGAVAGGVVALTPGNPAAIRTAGTSNADTLATAAVVRTNLTSSVQLGGSIGYTGSYTVVAPSGTSFQALAAARQAVTKDRQGLSADRRASSDASAAAAETISVALAELTKDRRTLRADQKAKRQECTGSGTSSMECSSATQAVTQDESQLEQAEQQLTSDRASDTETRQQDRAMVQSDRTQLAADEGTLAADQATALNPRTTYTALPRVGQVIREDHAVYSLNDEPVPLLYGSVTPYRAFYLGMSDGADVGELTADLIALGYGTGITQTNHYSLATATAVERWQAALGLPQTGEILLGEVVFEPGPIRVTSVTPSVGDSISGAGGGTGGGGAGGNVLTATSTTPIVTVDLPVSQEYQVKAGDRVSIVLPNGSSTVGGRIETVGTVATCPGGGATGTGTGSAGESPCSSAGSGTNSSPTVTVTISFDKNPPGSSSDQAPVNVDITSQRADHVLAVPVSALLALEGGGFGVDVVTRKTTHLVGVTTGLYSNSLVQVSGSVIRAGMRVEVPSS